MTTPLRVRFRLSALDIGLVDSGEQTHVLIEAAAGYGKTQLLRRIADNLSQAQPVFLVEGHWIAAGIVNPTDDDMLRKVILVAIGPTAASSFEEALSEHRKVVLIFDGLNEVGASRRELEALLDRASVTPGVSVIAAQRPSLSYRPPEGYVAGFIMPLDVDFVKHRFPSVSNLELRLLQIPLFFDLKSKGKATGSTREEAIANYFQSCLVQLPRYASFRSLTPEAQAPRLQSALLSIAQCAYEMYLHDRSIAMRSDQIDSEGWLREIGDVSGAVNATFMVREDDLVRFRHQLFHDWGAALWVHQGGVGSFPSVQDAVLDAITMERQSFDVLAFVVQRLARESQSAAESAVLRIYDWDFPAAVAVLLDWEDATEDPNTYAPSMPLRIAIRSLIADKKFDGFKRGIERFERVRPAIEPLLEEEIGLPAGYDQEALVESVGDFDASGAPSWFEEWVAIFADRLLDEELIARLESDSPVIGWTAANTLARRAIGLSAFEQLVGAYTRLVADGSTDYHTQRWRMVHALMRSQEAVEFLSGVAASSEENRDVRYGALRSLVSIAWCCDPAQVDRTLECLDTGMTAEALSDARLASILMQCSIPSESLVSAERLEAVRPVISSLMRRRIELLAASGSADVEAWQKRVDELEALTP
jgi:hypothetical protein